MSFRYRPSDKCRNRVVYRFGTMPRNSPTVGEVWETLSLTSGQPLQFQVERIEGNVVTLFHRDGRRQRTPLSSMGTVLHYIETIAPGPCSHEGCTEAAPFFFGFVGNTLRLCQAHLPQEPPRIPAQRPRPQQAEVLTEASGIHLGCVLVLQDPEEEPQPPNLREEIRYSVTYPKFVWVTGITVAASGKDTEEVALRLQPLLEDRGASEYSVPWVENKYKPLEPKHVVELQNSIPRRDESTCPTCGIQLFHNIPEDSFWSCGYDHPLICWKWLRPGLSQDQWTRTLALMQKQYTEPPVPVFEVGPEVWTLLNQLGHLHIRGGEVCRLDNSPTDQRHAEPPCVVKDLQTSTCLSQGLKLWGWSRLVVRAAGPIVQARWHICPQCAKVAEPGEKMPDVSGHCARCHLDWVWVDVSNISITAHLVDRCRQAVQGYPKGIGSIDIPKGTYTRLTEGDPSLAEWDSANTSLSPYGVCFRLLAGCLEHARVVLSPSVPPVPELDSLPEPKGLNETWHEHGTGAQGVLVAFMRQGALLRTIPEGGFRTVPHEVFQKDWSLGEPNRYNLIMED